MLTLMLMLATPAYIVPPGSAERPACKVAGANAGRSKAKTRRRLDGGKWDLGQRYFTLHVCATGANPYEPAIAVGAGDQPRANDPVFSDTFGGLYEPSLCLRELEQGGFVQRYRFPDATYLNRFSRSGTGWRWTITEQPNTKPPSVFADNQQRPAQCRGVHFDYRGS